MEEIGLVKGAVAEEFSRILYKYKMEYKMGVPGGELAEPCVCFIRNGVHKSAKWPRL